MKPLGDLRKHLRLVLRMGRASRTDLVAARQEGRLRSRDWAGMVQTCRRCTWAGRCPDWIDAHHDTGACPPDTCLNRDKFRELAAGQTAKETV